MTPHNPRAAPNARVRRSPRSASLGSTGSRPPQRPLLSFLPLSSDASCGRLFTAHWFVSYVECCSHLCPMFTVPVHRVAPFVVLPACGARLLSCPAIARSGPHQHMASTTTTITRHMTVLTLRMDRLAPFTRVQTLPPTRSFQPTIPQHARSRSRRRRWSHAHTRTHTRPMTHLWPRCSGRAAVSCVLVSLLRFAVVSVYDQ